MSEAKGERSEKKETPEDARRTQRWFLTSRQRLALGFDDIHVSKLPAMASRHSSICLCLEKLEGWSVPLQLLEAVDKDVNYNEIVYFVSRIIDPSCVGVLEIVASKRDKEQNLVMSQHGCGWTLISVFGTHFPDISDGYEAVMPAKTSVYQGSPRELMQADFVDLKPRLKELAGCNVQYRLFSSRKLLKAQALIGQNELIGRFDVIPGLVRKTVTLPGEIRARELPCIGDSEVIMDKKGIQVIPSFPTLAAPFTMEVIDWHLLLTGRNSIESRLRVHITKMLRDGEDPAIATIASRALKLGVHNSHSLMNSAVGEWVSVELEIDPDDPDILLCPAKRAQLKLSGYFPHEVVAMVILVEFEVSLPARPSDAALASTHTFLRDGQLITTVCMGAAAYVPFDGQKFILHNVGDGKHDSDDLAIELELRSNDVCRLLTKSLIYRDVVAEGDAEEKRPLMGFDIKLYDDSDGGREIEDGEVFSGEYRTAMKSTVRLDSENGSDVDERDVMRRSGASLRRTHEPQSLGKSFTRSHRRHDDDAVSTVESLVAGTSEASSIRLDSSYYMDKENVKYDDGDGRRRFLAPAAAPVDLTASLRNRNSLLSRSLNTRLASADKPPVPDRHELREAPRDVVSSLVGKSTVVAGGSTAHVRDISRAGRARLNRHGITEAYLAPDKGPSSGVPMVATADVELEARDVLAMHEIRVQFAGYRAGFMKASSLEDDAAATHYTPRSVYFSYQFYTCQATRSEILKLVPAAPGEMAVLVREEATSSRNESPLILQHNIDCSGVSSTEKYEFADYLAHKILFVDVWDADSLLQLGTIGIPLRQLMRQGASSSRLALECDVITGNDVNAIDGGTTATVIVDRGPLVGTVIGSVSVILANHGHHGEHKAEQKDAPSDALSMDGMNWRASGMRQSSATGKRPKTCVRAKPLSESAPDLSRALDDCRADGKASLRSLSAIRGGEDLHTLTYDEIALLYRHFHGTIKGTIQYTGPLMQLLDVPSKSNAIKKFINVYRRSQKSGISMEQVLRQYTNAEGTLALLDFKEFLKDIMERFGVISSDEELNVLMYSFIPAEGASKVVKPNAVLEFCRLEAERQDWAAIGKRLRRTVQNAYMSGVEVEELLSEKDIHGSQVLPVHTIEEVLNDVAKHGKLTKADVSFACSKFQRDHTVSGKSIRGISLVEFMAFFGRDYTGNIRMRLKNAMLSGASKKKLDGNNVTEKIVLALTSGQKLETPLLIDELETRLHTLDVFTDLSHDHVRQVLHKATPEGQSKVSVLQLLRYVGILGATEGGSGGSSVEELLKVLLERVQRDGVSVDQAFRHFDADGNGVISQQELIDGLSQLRVFDSIANWKKEIPLVVKRFDKDGDGSVSLPEFFKYLNVTYSPNILQKLTRIFAAVADKHSLDSIFSEFDSDKDGQITPEELQRGIESIGTFRDVAKEDLAATIRQFDKDNDGMISVQEFVDFFGKRIVQAKRERKNKTLIRLKRRFNEVIGAVVEDTKASVESIFKHFDKSRGDGDLSKADFISSLRGIPFFKTVSDADMTALADVLDSDGNGTISIQEFKDFLNERVGEVKSNRKPSASIDQLRKILKIAAKKGLSARDIFESLDKDRSGALSTVELQRGLSNLPFFKQLTDEDYKNLFLVLDADGSGEVSCEEFVSKLESNDAKDEEKAHAEEKEAKATTKSEAKDVPKNSRDTLIAEMQRVAKADGSIEALLAYLDTDENGVVAQKKLFKLMMREHVFDVVAESEVEKLLQPLERRDGSYPVSSLLKFFTNNDSTKIVDKVESDSDDDDDMERRRSEYAFSRDPEIHALEKKFRSLARQLGKRGVDIESLFRQYDTRGTGMIRRTEFLEILSKLGLYLLEKGRALEASEDATDSLRQQQQRQLSRIRGDVYGEAAPRAASRLLRVSDRGGSNDFEEHMKSMALINWYRQSQKKMLLQRVISHSLCNTISLYPRFGKTLFFEYPITNPFAHEERFLIEVTDPELRVVTAFDEWIQLRHRVRPSVGELGGDPVELEMFDRDGMGNTQVALLAHETLHVPFTFLTLEPYAAAQYLAASDKKPEIRRSYDAKSSRRSESKEAKGEEAKHASEPELPPARVVEVRVISGSHGHIVAVLRVNICPRSFVVDRTLRFYEPENSVMKRRIQLTGYNATAMYPGETAAASKYVHCVEEQTAGVKSETSRVVVEWGPAEHVAGGPGSALDLIIRYRCSAFPSAGNFYILLYDDPYQCSLHEVWYVSVQTRQRLDFHCAVGSAYPIDLVIRGDKFGRRARAFASAYTQDDRIQFAPANTFQLVPGAFNRVAVTYAPTSPGPRRLQLNIVDVDTKELISAWLLMATVSAPHVSRSYDVDVPIGVPLHKKIVFKNPWDVARKFLLVSSDTALMRPRVDIMDVAGQGNAYIKLYFAGARKGQDAAEVYLFMNNESGQSEETFLFRIHPTHSSI